MTHQIGLHWIRTHPDGRDYDHIAKMQYPSVKTFEWMHRDRNFCANLIAAIPKDAYFLARNHPRSEEKDDVWRDPVGTGVRHANAWAFDIANGECHLPIDRTFFLGCNELDATSGDRNAIDLYNEAFLDRLQSHGLRGGAFNFSTGHPRTVDGTGATKADYSVFERSHQAIVRGNHIGILHIYGTANQPCVPGHYDRLKACTWTDVEWIVGECGADEHVIGGGAHDGFLTSMRDNPSRYCQWLDELIIGVNDPRIHSYQVFTYDFSHPWASFDVRPIRDALESYQWRHKRPAKANTTHIPTVSTGPGNPLGAAATPAFVNAISGVNLRAAPNTASPILVAIPYAAQVALTGVGPDGWLKARYGNHEGYVAAQYISREAPTPTQPTAPTNEAEAWARCIAFVRNWEGGWADHPNDPGGATMKGITLATYTRWRQAKGQPAPTKEDLRRISDAETNQIYYEWYWKASGADKLPWPLCLAHFDTAVNAGPGKAAEMLTKSNGQFLRYMGHVGIWYTTIPNFDHFGRAWMRRRWEILLEASK